MAPSNSRNRMTRPLRTRPSQRAGFEIGAFSAVVGMAFCWMDCLECLALRLQIDRGAEASVHVERHRIVLVRDFPLTFDLAEAQRLAIPEFDLMSARRGARHQIEAVADAEIAAHNN